MTDRRDTLPCGCVREWHDEHSGFLYPCPSCEAEYAEREARAAVVGTIPVDEAFARIRASVAARAAEREGEG